MIVRGNGGNINNQHSSISKTTLAIICFFLGIFGVHRFCTGKYFTGVLYVLTGGFSCMGVLFDFIMIITGNFKDSEGRLIE